MTDTIAVTGIVATDPNRITTAEGLAIASFRLASHQRRYDRAENAWVDAETNWYTISTFRQLALNVGTSVKKGDRVVVSGRLRIRDWSTGERQGITADVEADAVGHDLRWGSSTFERTMNSSPAQAEPEPQAAPDETLDAERAATAPTPF